MNYILAINKPTGLTSSDVVVKVRRILSTAYGKKIKVGHMGTLDPGAAGVLLVGVDKGARLFDFLLKKSKSYIGRLTFGIQTDTLDSFGKVVSIGSLPSYEAVVAALNKFLGEIEQIPPKYSAIKINGQKAYQLARKDIEVIIEPRKVTIFDLKIVNVIKADDKVKSIDLYVKCSSGTYIRTLFEDIAFASNSVGYMAYLIRDSLHTIGINDCITLEELDKNPLNYFIDPLNIIKTLMPVYELDDKEFEYIHSGRTITTNILDEYVALTKQGKLCFIAKNNSGELKSISNFEDNEENI